MKLLNPKSSESWIPYLVLDKQIKFGFFLQVMTWWGCITAFGWRIHRPKIGGRPPFGLYIRLPFVMARWGCA